MPFVDASGPLLGLTCREDVLTRTRAFAVSGAVLCHGIVALQGEAVFLSAPPGAAGAPAPPRFCGSDEATTCCIVFLRAPDGSRAACAHLDCPESVAPFIAACAEAGLWAAAGGGGGGGGGAPLEVHLVGSTAGWKDSGSLVAAVLAGLHGAPAPLRLLTAAVLAENADKGVARDAPRRPPLHAGAALDVTTGELRPARFVTPGPDELPRRARCFVRGGTACRVAYAEGAWAPAAYPGSPVPGSDALEWGLRRSALEKMLSMGDGPLLQLTSTSPEAEADGYCERMRSVLGWIGTQM
jgi:hypothetical protein